MSTFILLGEVLSGPYEVSGRDLLYAPDREFHEIMLRTVREQLQIHLSIYHDGLSYWQGTGSQSPHRSFIHKPANAAEASIEDAMNRIHETQIITQRL